MFFPYDYDLDDGSVDFRSIERKAEAERAAYFAGMVHHALDRIATMLHRHRHHHRPGHAAHG